MKVSFITTVFNEEKSITSFLTSLHNQTIKADEIIVVDGGSTDSTVKRIKQFDETIKVMRKKGNRSVGRNEAIKHATNEIILCSDAGNILDKKWIEHIIKPFTDSSVDVVAGYYKGKYENVFQKCLIPYVLVMPDQVHPDEFLPATRSIAFKKSVWKKVGKFPEEYSHNEDYVFANNLKKSGANIVFAKHAVVSWLPRTSWKDAFIMFYRFAVGDAEASFLRTSVLLLFMRYLVGIYLIFLAVLYKNYLCLGILGFGIGLYILWSIWKNYRYVRKRAAIGILPALQFLSDGAVITGTITGLVKRLTRVDYVSYLKQHRVLLLLISIYCLLILATLHSGAPNQNHPFPYNMDEWHQLEAVKETFKKGTPNTPGAANGTLFHFLISGFYLAPFILSKYISVTEMRVFDLAMRERVFELVRLSTLMWGVLSLFVVIRLAELTNASRKITLFLFIFCPLWLSLSGYFKYDIGLMFWILLSLLFFIKYSYTPTKRNYLLASIFPAVAFAVKVSAIPLLPIYVLSFFLFHPDRKKDISTLLIGMFSYGCLALFLGLPDMFFGKGNIVDYLVNNILETPHTTDNILFGMNPWMYLFTRHYPIIFGQGLLTLFAISSLYILYSAVKKGCNQYKVELFLLLSALVFVISIVPLQILGGGNRSLVLLPFLTLITGIGIKRIYVETQYKFIITFLFIIMCTLQVYVASAAVYLKVAKSPQDVASSWIITHIPARTEIGIENIPIYQAIPDVIQKEFYFTQSGGGANNRFTYRVIDSKTARLPQVIVMTNGEIDEKYARTSPKKDLIARLTKEKYKKIRTFYPDLGYQYLSDLDYYYSWLIPSPYTTTVYIK